jgi:hypothetical protein
VTVTAPPVTWNITGQAQRVASALAPAGSVMLINYDLVNPVYYGTDPGVNPDTGLQLQALGSFTVTTSSDVWLVSAGPAVDVGVVPGGTQWAPSPALVAAQISALGLATQTWQETQNTSINAPGYGPSTYDRQVAQETNIPANIQVMGAPPFILSAQSAAQSLATAAGSPYTLFTAPAEGARVWAVHLSLSVGTDTSYSAGLDDAYARVFAGTLILANVNCVFAAPGISVDDMGDLNIGGIVIPGGDACILDVNNGVNITDAYIRAAVVVIWSAGTGGGGSDMPLYLPPPSGDTTGATDDLAILPILSAMSAGQVCNVISTGYYTKAGWVLNSQAILTGPYQGRPSQTAPAVVTAAAGSNLNAVISDTAFNGTGAATPTNMVQVTGVTVDGNSSGQTAGDGHGIALLTEYGTVKWCGTVSTYGSGIVLADTNTGGTTTTITQDENAVIECRVVQPGGSAGTVYGIWVMGVSGKQTDGYMYDNIVNFNALSPASAIPLEMDCMAGWRVFRNHMYDILGSGPVFKECNQAWIIDNYVDNFGANSASGTTYYGMQITPTPFGRTTVRGSRLFAEEGGGAGAGTYIHYNITSPAGDDNEIEFADNSVRQKSPGTGTSTAYAFSAGTGGTLWVQGFIGTQRITPSTATTVAAPVITGAGTVNIPGNSG